MSEVKYEREIIPAINRMAEDIAELKRRVASLPPSPEAETVTEKVEALEALAQEAMDESIVLFVDTSHPEPLKQPVAADPKRRGKKSDVV
jgi:beta-glucosidase-like glycosyl hydrolase